MGLLSKVVGAAAVIGVATAATAAGTYLYKRWTRDEKDEAGNTLTGDKPNSNLVNLQSMETQTTVSKPPLAPLESKETQTTTGSKPLLIEFKSAGTQTEDGELVQLDLQQINKSTKSVHPSAEELQFQLLGYQIKSGNLDIRVQLNKIFDCCVQLNMRLAKLNQIALKQTNQKA